MMERGEHVLEMKINKLPAGTWRWLRMNNARIEQEADLALCQVAIQCPDAIVKTETSEEQLNQIRTGMGEDMTKLLQESKTKAICFTAEEGESISFSLTGLLPTMVCLPIHFC